MNMWKGEKLYGPDRRLTRAQLEECDRVPTAAEGLAATIEGMSGSPEQAMRTLLVALELPREVARERAELLRPILRAAGVVPAPRP